MERVKGEKKQIEGWQGVSCVTMGPIQDGVYVYRSLNTSRQTRQALASAGFTEVTRVSGMHGDCIFWARPGTPQVNQL